MPEARKVVEWVRQRMLPSGILSEQINPYTLEFISVAPLAWSQAEFVNTAIDLLSEPMHDIHVAEGLEH
jgi:GH15 family glucan-1,4-alpha-glucosidase